MIFRNDPTDQKNLPRSVSASLPSAGVLVAGKYRIEQLLDCGNMGAVFRAQHEEMRSAVALKCLLPRLSGVAEFRERFMREARTAARIRHPNVVHIYDVGEHNGVPFMVMELLEGQPLDLALANGLPIAEALRLLIEAMRGVEAAHAENIVHRDVKPGNIFIVGGTGVDHAVAKVLDFGISKSTDGRSELQPITAAGETLGTPHYMSLEQLNGARDIDARTDIYSFGVILYEVLTRTYPFDADTVGSLASDVARGRPRPPSGFHPDIPEVFDDVVLRALASDRADRYPTIGELIDALTAAAPQLGTIDRANTDAPLRSLAPDSELSTQPTRILLARATPWRVFASVALTVGILSAATWLSLSLGPALAAPAPREQAIVIVEAQPPAAAAATLELTELPPPAAAEAPVAPPVEAVQLAEPAQPPKVQAPRRKRVALPATEPPATIAAPTSPSVVTGQRSGTLRRDAF